MKKCVRCWRYHCSTKNNICSRCKNWATETEPKVKKPRETPINFKNYEEDRINSLINKFWELTLKFLLKKYTLSELEQAEIDWDNIYIKSIDIWFEKKKI